MKNAHVIFVVVTVLVMSCLSFAAPEAPEDLYNNFRTFARIINTINSNYVDAVDKDKLFYGAYEGMLQTLDPYSMFLPPEDKEDLQAETKGEFGGLGIEISTDKNGILQVITPIEDSPAFKAGVLAGDRIIRIEGKTTKGMTVREAVQQLRGPKGTPVEITVFHENGKIEAIKVIRDIIKLESIKDPKFVDERFKIGYIRLTQFQANTAKDLDKTVSEMLDNGMRALIIDLRYNPGGLLTTAIEVADRFIDDGVIVSTRGRATKEQVFRATKGSTYPYIPLVVLVSNRSASAAEIFSGAIQDHRRGLIIGMRTFGKASVQSIINLEDGKSAIRLTTAHYYTPSGRLIHHNQNDPEQKIWGVDPDIEVKFTLEDELALWEHWRNQRREGKNGDKPAHDESSTGFDELDEYAALKAMDVRDADGKPIVKKQEFRDLPLESAIHALKGVLITQGRPASPANTGVAAK